jgi:hypothetical protein
LNDAVELLYGVRAGQYCVADVERELAKVKRKRGYACLGCKAFKTIEPSGALFGRLIPWGMHDMVEQGPKARTLGAFVRIGVCGVQNVLRYASLPKETIFVFPPDFRWV